MDLMTRIDDLFNKVDNKIIDIEYVDKVKSQLKLAAALEDKDEAAFEEMLDILEHIAVFAESNINKQTAFELIFTTLRSKNMTNAYIDLLFNIIGLTFTYGPEIIIYARKYNNMITDLFNNSMVNLSRLSSNRKFLQDPVCKKADLAAVEATLQQKVAML